MTTAFRLYILGATGRVTTNEYGDRVSDYTIFSIQMGKYVPIFDIVATKSYKIVSRLNSSEWLNIVWPGDVQETPRDTPPCGWHSEQCTVTRGTWLQVN